MTNVSIRKMRVYMSALELQSFTKAAMAQNISQPAATIIINQIEEEFQCELFHRSGAIRRAVATETGKEVAEAFSKILSTYDFELALMHTASQGRKQKSKILIQTSFDVALNNKWLNGLVENYRDNDLTLEVMPRSEILERVGKREATIGLIDGVAEARNLDFTPVGGFELVLAVPREHTRLLHVNGKIDWENLPDTMLFFNNLNPTLTRQFSRRLKEVGDRVPRVIAMNSMISVISLMRKQNWAALIPDAMLAYVNSHIPCSHLPFKDISLSSQFGMITPWGNLSRIPRSITQVKNCFHASDEFMN